MQSPSANSITDWLATTFAPCAKRPDKFEALFGEWLTARFEAERRGMLEEMQSQWQTRHLTLHAEISAAVHQLAQHQSSALDGPRAPQPPPPPAPVGDACPLTPDVLQRPVPVVKGSPVGLLVDPLPGSPASASNIVQSTVRGTPDTSGDKRGPCESVKLKTASRGLEDGNNTCDRWHRLEVFFGVVIVLNAFVLLAEEQVKGIGVGHNLGVSGFSESPQDVFPFASGVFDAFNVFFSLMFTIELVCRLHHRKLQFYRYLWIWLDLIAVPLAWLNIIGAGIVPASVLRTIRVLRLFELIHSMEYFDKLYLLIRSIKASFGALFWSLVLIFFTQVVAALFLLYMLSGFYEDQSQPAAVRQQVFERFGTASRILITMFQVVFASWPAPCWLLVLNVSEWYGVFFILYRCVLGFSLVKVVTSMFIQETHRICQKDQEIAKAKTKCDSETHKKQLLDLFVEHDESGDGTISWQEFQHLMANPRLIKWTERMGISHLLLEELFGVLQKTGRGDNEHERYVDLESFVSGAVKVGGAARSIDILAVLTAMDEIQGKLPTYDMRVEKPFESFLDEQVTRMPSRPSVTDVGRPRSPVMPTPDDARRRPPFSLAEWAPA